MLQNGRRDWLYIVASAVSLVSLAALVISAWELYSPEDGFPLHRLLQVKGSNGQLMLPLGHRTVCVAVETRDGTRRFITAQLRDDRPIVFVGELTQPDIVNPTDAAYRERSGESLQSCMTLAGKGVQRLRLDDLEYAPCPGGNCSIGLNENIEVKLKEAQLQPLRLFTVAAILSALAVFFVSSLVLRSDAKYPRLLPLMLALSGILLARLLISINTTISNPVFAERLMIIGLELILVPSGVGFLLVKKRLSRFAVTVLALIVVSWVWWAWQDSLISEQLLHRANTLFHASRETIRAALKPLVVPMAQVSILALLFAFIASPLVGNAKSCQSTSMRWIAPFLILSLVAATAIAILGEGEVTDVRDAIKRVPYLSLSVALIAFGALIVVVVAQHQKRAATAALTGGAMILLVGASIGDRGTSVVAAVSALLALTMCLISATPGAENRTNSWTLALSVVSLLTFALLMGAVGWKLWTLTDSYRGIANLRDRPAVERMEAWANAAATSPLAETLGLCVVPGSVAELTAKTAAAIDGCFSRNYQPSVNDPSTYQRLEMHASKTRIYSWLYGQPLRGVWTQTALENMSGYVQGLANSLPAPGASLFFGDRELPSPTSFQSRARRDGLDFEWLTGLRWIRPFGIVGIAFVLSCYVLLYQSINRGRAGIPARVVVAAFGCATAWGLLQTQGVLPFTGFSVPLLTFTSFARDWLPNVTILLAVLAYSTRAEASNEH